MPPTRGYAFAQLLHCHLRQALTYDRCARQLVEQLVEKGGTRVLLFE
jgi:hypothetical protein